MLTEKCSLGFSLSLVEVLKIFNDLKKWCIVGEDFRLDSNPLGKWFINTRQNKGPKIGPYGTPTPIGDHLEVWLLKATLWCLLLRNELDRNIFLRGHGGLV